MTWESRGMKECGHFPPRFYYIPVQLVPTGERFKPGLVPQPVPSCKHLKGLVAGTTARAYLLPTPPPPPPTPPSLARNCGRTRVRRFLHRSFEASPLSVSINISLNSKRTLARIRSDAANKLLKPQWVKT